MGEIIKFNENGKIVEYEILYSNGKDYIVFNHTTTIIFCAFSNEDNVRVIKTQQTDKTIDVMFKKEPKTILHPISYN